jgi:hypothetical protein
MARSNLCHLDYRARFIVLSVCAAAIYGIIHDEITAHLAPEYFTVAHPALIPTQSPFWLGLFWGVVATTPMALLLGWLLGAIAHSPNLPPEPMANLAKTLAVLFIAMAASAILAGFSAWIMANRYGARFPDAWDAAVPSAHRPAFLAVWAAHIASYASSLVIFSVWAGRMWLRRNRPRVLALLPATPAAKLRFALLVAAAIAVLIWRRTT